MFKQPIDKEFFIKIYNLFPLINKFCGYLLLILGLSDLWILLALYVELLKANATCWSLYGLHLSNWRVTKESESSTCLISRKKFVEV